MNNTNKKFIFKNCALSTDCITEINNTQIDDAQKIDVVVTMYNLIEYITVMLIGRYQGVCGNAIQMNHLQKIIEMLLIFLMIAIIVLH